jgi:hypothetical protein
MASGSADRSADRLTEKSFTMASAFSGDRKLRLAVRRLSMRDGVTKLRF